MITTASEFRGLARVYGGKSLGVSYGGECYQFADMDTLRQVSLSIGAHLPSFNLWCDISDVQITFCANEGSLQPQIFAKFTATKLSALLRNSLPEGWLIPHDEDAEPVDIYTRYNIACRKKTAERISYRDGNWFFLPCTSGKWQQVPYAQLRAMLRGAGLTADEIDRLTFARMEFQSDIEGLPGARAA